MIVCVCLGVTDRTVRNLVRQGASSLYEVALGCSAGACCGGCQETLVSILQSEQQIEPRGESPERKLATAS